MKPNYSNLVQAARAEALSQGIDVNASECHRFEVTKRAAWIIQTIDPDVGLLEKASGNNCEGYAVDILCWKDGTIVDCLGAGPDGPATALWQENPNPVDPGRWRPPVAPVVPAPAPAPQPEPEPAPALPPGPSDFDRLMHDTLVLGLTEVIAAVNEVNQTLVGMRQGLEQAIPDLPGMLGALRTLLDLPAVKKGAKK